jgi:hypothetical protein
VIVTFVSPNNALFVKGPCGCAFSLYDHQSGGHTGSDGPLARIRHWLIPRFALNTDHDLWSWVFIIGAAAHLEYLGVAVLWVDEGKPLSFPEYRPDMTLGRAEKKLRSLLDATTSDTLERVAVLRNSVAHRGATWGIPYPRAGTGVYKARHVFTDTQGSNELMADMHAATQAMSRWLREHGLTGDEA